MSDANQKKAISRRDFFRMAGLGAGAAMAASVLKTGTITAKAATGEFSDPAGRPERPWWVRTVDEPTTEIDWAKMERYNERYIPELGKGTMRGGGFVGYAGQEEADRYNKMGADLLQKGVEDSVPGYSLRDQALDAANDVMRDISFLGPQRATTPEEWGVPKWTGTPEEAAKMVRAAMRHIGASQVGFVELNENTRKLIYSIDPDGHELVFADVDEPAETETQRIIPNKAKWVIVYTVQMSEETLTRSDCVRFSNYWLDIYARPPDPDLNSGVLARTGIYGPGRIHYECLGDCPRLWCTGWARGAFPAEPPRHA